jgi:hypothetical protein
VRRKETPPSSAKVYDPNDLIALPDAIALLAERDRRKHDTDRVKKARMRARIKYAVDNGALAETLRRSKRCYVYGRIVAWAQENWPGKYDDLEAIRVPSVGSVKGVLRGLTGKSSGGEIPTTLAECQSRLAQTMRRIVTLEEQLIVAREDADRLRPDAEARQRVRAVNKLNAQRRRPRAR